MPFPSVTPFSFKICVTPSVSVFCLLALNLREDKQELLLLF